MTGTTAAALMVVMAHLGPTRAAMGRAATLVLDALLPPQCLSCRTPVEGTGRLCGACWARIDWIEDPVCASCGLPFDYDLGPEALCAACTARPPAYRRARAAMRYDDHCRGLLLGFKYSDRTEAAPAFGAWMARAGAGLLARADLLAPVPLHRLRLLARRYNQAALLASATADAAGKRVVPDLLVRTRATPSQGGLSPRRRMDNVRGAFAVRRRRQDLLAGKNVLLVDDVMTTGATVEACARALARGGAGSVEVLTLARVVRSGGQAL